MIRIPLESILNYRCTAHHIIQQTVPPLKNFCANCVAIVITWGLG